MAVVSGLFVTSVIASPIPFRFPEQVTFKIGLVNYSTVSTSTTNGYRVFLRIGVLGRPSFGYFWAASQDYTAPNQQLDPQHGLSPIEFDTPFNIPDDIESDIIVSAMAINGSAEFGPETNFFFIRRSSGGVIEFSPPPPPKYPPDIMHGPSGPFQ
jgi:hypothetical protein